MMKKMIKTMILIIIVGMAQIQVVQIFIIDRLRVIQKFALFFENIVM